MNKLVLPSVRVGLIDISWTNGSRVKPLNPIPRDTIVNFEEKKNHKIDWVGPYTGLITLEGDYNYLIFNELECYFLEKTRVIDINKMIYVYTAVKDHWQTFIGNPNNYIKGCLIKTTNEEIVWDHIQTTKAPSTEVNNEQILKACYTDACTKDRFSDNFNLTMFHKEKGFITQFPPMYRFTQEGLKKFYELASGVSTSETPTNTIHAWCSLTEGKNWRNRIANIVGDFLTTDYSSLTLANPSNLNDIAPKLGTLLKDTYSLKNPFIITKKRASGSALPEFPTILKSTEVVDYKIERLDLSAITDIRLLDSTTLEEKTPFNRSILNMDPGWSTDAKPGAWYLKAKMYSPFHEAKNFQGLNISNKIIKKNYVLNTTELESRNIGSTDKSYSYAPKNIIENDNPPVFYHPNWLETVTNSNMVKKIYEKKINTELGFLLYGISDFKGTTLQTGNKFIYKGDTKIQLTTGLRFSDIRLKCPRATDIDSQKLVTGDFEVRFSEIYKEDLAKSFWLTLWNVYLWRGDIGRSFEGLSRGVMENDFAYTIPVCWSKRGKIFDAAAASAEATENNEKLPTYGVLKASYANTQRYVVEGLEELTRRREGVEIRQDLNHPYIAAGDVYWNDLQYGLFNSRDQEAEVDKPALVLWVDKKYTIEYRGEKITPVPTPWAYRPGLLRSWTPKIEPNPENLLITNEKAPKIITIRPLLNEPVQVPVFDEAQYKYVLKRFFTPGGGGSPVPAGHTLHIYDWKWTKHPWTGIDWDTTKTFPRKSDGNFHRVCCVTSGAGTTYTYMTVYFESCSPIWLYSSFEYPPIVKYANENLPAWRFTSLKDGNYNLFTTWSNRDEAYEALRLPANTNQDIVNKLGIPTSAKGKLQKLIANVYREVNNERINNNYEYVEIDDEYLSTKGTSGVTETHIFEFRAGAAVSFYALIKWPNNVAVDKGNAAVELVIADPTLLKPKAKTNVTLVPSASTINPNLVQVVNQQNFLYVYGHTFPIKTKMVTKSGEVDYHFTVEPLVIGDPAATHYRIFFRGAGGDLIKTNISVLKKEIANAEQTQSAYQLADLRINLEEGRRNRELALLSNEEKERRLRLNVRNLGDDLAYDTNQHSTNTFLQIASGIGNSIGRLTSGGIAGALSLVGDASSMYTSWAKSSRDLEIKQRGMHQADLAATHDITLSKYQLENTHKTEEMRERNRIYELSNTHIASTPNNADVLEALQALDTDGYNIAVYNRYPEGALLDHLTNYHKNWGFDLYVNDQSLSVKRIRDDEAAIYQFSRVDETSITDTVEQEIIKSTFVNGVYLKEMKYEPKQLSLLELRRKHQEKVAALKAETERLQKLAEERRISEIRALELAREQAKEEYVEALEDSKKCKAAYEEASKQNKALTLELEQLKGQLAAFGQDEEIKIKNIKANLPESEVITDFHNQKDALNAQINTLTGQIAQNEETIRKSQEIIAKGDALENQIRQLGVEIDGLKNDKNTLTRVKATLEGEKRSLSSQKAALLEEKAKLQALVDKGNKEKAEIQALYDKIKSDFSLMAPVCNAALAVITSSADSISKLQTEKEELEKQIASGNLLKAEADKKIKELEEKVKKQALVIQSAEVNCNTLMREKEALNANIKKLEDKIKELEARKPAVDDGSIVKLNKQIEELNKTNLALTKSYDEVIKKKNSLTEFRKDAKHKWSSVALFMNSDKARGYIQRTDDTWYTYKGYSTTSTQHRLNPDNGKIESYAGADKWKPTTYEILKLSNDGYFTCGIDSVVSIRKGTTYVGARIGYVDLFGSYHYDFLVLKNKTLSKLSLFQWVTKLKTALDNISAIWPQIDAEHSKLRANLQAINKEYGAFNGLNGIAKKTLDNLSSYSGWIQNIASRRY